MLTTSLLLALAMAADAPAAAPTEPFISACQIISIDNQAVPAADSGVLTILRVKPGTRVKKGEEIGRIDDSEATAMLHIKQLEYEVAKQMADSDVDIRYSKAAADVAQTVYAKLEESNRQFKGTVTAIDILKGKLDLRRSRLAIEQAVQESAQAELTAKAKNAEVGAAQVALDRRILRAPFDGIVVKVVKKPGEWVAPGEAVVHIVGVNRLNVMGYLDASDWSPSDVQDRKVTVEVMLPRGKTKKVTGKITFVSPVVTIGDLPVTAEIDTPMQGDLPLIRAGLNASMTIHVNQRPVAKSARAVGARAAPVRSTSTKSRGKK